MLRLSLRFPDVLLTLRGKGEEDDDRWVSYYLNGGVQSTYAEIRYEPFDPEKLVDPVLERAAGG